MPTASRLVFVLLALAACSEKTVELSGRVYQGVDQEAVAAGATLEVTTFEGEALGQATTDADGFFAVSVREDENVFLRIDEDGSPTATFAGVVSFFDEELPNGYLFTVPEPEIDELEALFAGCSAGSGSGVVFGEVRHQDLVESDGENAINRGSLVKLFLEDGSEQFACYLDDDGEGYDPDSLLTGETGRFALFGVPAGFHTLQISFDTSLQEASIVQYPVLVLEQASVSPWFPAWVTLP